MPFDSKLIQSLLDDLENDRSERTRSVNDTDKFGQSICAGSIQFYEYDDRIEIQNHGNLYGKANAENFPHVNDYRNIVIAESLRVLGFVNRFSRGVQRVEDDLIANGNVCLNLTSRSALHLK